jgi:hypothetical protein
LTGTYRAPAAVAAPAPAAVAAEVIETLATEWDEWFLWRWGATVTCADEPAVSGPVPGLGGAGWTVDFHRCATTAAAGRSR